MKLKYIKEIDVFGPKIELRLGDKKTHKTLCGATMTLFVAACSVTAVILIGKELIQKDSPTVSFEQILADESNNEISSHLSSFGSFSQVSLNDIQFMVGITDQYGDDISNDLKDQLSIQIQFVQKDGNNYQKVKIQTENCNSQSFQNYKLSNLDPSNYLCLKDHQLFNVWGYDTDFKAQYFEVSVTCKTGQCQQQSQKLKLNLLYQDQYFSPNKYAQCYSPIYNSKYIEFNLLQNGVDGSQDYNLILQKSTVVTDQGWLTSIYEKNNYLIVNDLAQSLNSNVDQELSLRIQIHPLRLVYQRSYLKVQGLLAVVGGLLKTLILIGRVLVKPIAKLSMNSELVNELFVFEEQRNKRLRQSLEKNMEKSSSESDNSSEIYEKDQNKLKKQYVLKELEQNENQDSQANQNQHSNHQIFDQYLKPKQIDKNMLQPDSYINQNDFMLQKQRNFINDCTSNNNNNQVKSNNNIFRKEYVVDQLKGIQQIKQRESIFDVKNISSIQKTKLNNFKNSAKDNKDLISQNSQQNYQNQFQQKSMQNYQITINDSDKKQKYSAMNTPKSKFLQENLANLQAQQNKFEGSAFKRVRSRSNSQTSQREKEVSIQKEQLGQEQKQAAQNTNDDQDLILIGEQNVESKDLNVEYVANENNVEANNDENKVFNARRANKYLTAEVSQNQYNSIKVEDSLKVFQSVKQNPNPQKQQENNPNEQQQLTKPNIQNKPTAFKRKGTTIITEILQKNYLVHKGIRKTTVKEQNEDNARFSNELENMQEKPLKFTCLDYIKYYFSQLKCLAKKKQIKYSVKKVTERFDIIYILQKLVEIDKLKVLLLSYEQQKLFEYMPKPVVQTDPEKQENNLMVGRMNADLQQNWTLLNSEKGNLDKFTEAFHAYKQIQMKQEKEPLDERLIMMLDPDVKRYFDITKADGSQVCTPNRNSRKVSIIPLKFNVPDQGQARSQMQQIKLQQQKDEVKMRLTSSFIENNYDQENQLKQEEQEHEHEIINLQHSNRLNNFYEKEENQLKLSQKYNGHMQFEPLLAPSGDASSPKSTQQFIQSQNSVQLKQHNDQKANPQTSLGEQIEENIQGITSYPRESICLNQIDFMENNNQYSKQLSSLSLKDNQFSFARKSIESPLFQFDPQKRNQLKMSSIKHKLLPVRQAASQSIFKSNDTMTSENEQSLHNKDSMEQQLIYKISRNSFQNMNGQKKRRCQSQHELENISEQQENEYQNPLFVQFANPKNISFGYQTILQSNDIPNEKYDQSMKKLITLNNSDETHHNEMANFYEKSLQEQQLMSRQPNQQFSKEKREAKTSEDYSQEINAFYNKFRKNSETDHHDDTPPIQANRQNSPTMSRLIKKHRKNTNSVGSENSMSNNMKKDEQNNQSLKGSQVLDLDSNFMSLHQPRLFFVNPFNRSNTNYNQTQENEIIRQSKDFIKNQGVNKINSNQSFQSIPEEYLRSKRGDFHIFNHINQQDSKNQQTINNMKNEEIKLSSKNDSNNFTNSPFDFKMKNNYFKSTFSQTEQNSPNNHKHDAQQDNNYCDEIKYPNRVSEPSQKFNHQNRSKHSSQHVSPFKNLNFKDLFQPITYNSISSQKQQINFQQTVSVNSNQSNFKQIKNSIASHQKETNNSHKTGYQQDNNQDKFQFFKDIDNSNNQNEYFKQQNEQLNHYDDINSQQSNNKKQQMFVEMTPQKQNQEDDASLKSFEQPQLTQQKSYRYSSINFNIPQQMTSQQKISTQKPQSSEKSKQQISANKIMKQRVSLNPQLISSQNQNGVNSSQVQNFLKKNNNAKLYESPYTQQQRFLKKRQQEKIEQQLRESQYSQQVQQVNNSLFQNHLADIQDFNRNPRSQHSQSHKSNKSQDRFFEIQNKVTANQGNNQTETSRQIARSPSLIQQDILLTTENDENKDFIPRNSTLQQQLSQNFQLQTEENEDLIQFNKTSRENSLSSSSQAKEKKNNNQNDNQILQVDDIIIFDDKETDRNQQTNNFD